MIIHLKLQEIYKFCSEEQLTNSTVDAEKDNEVASSPGQSQLSKLGPKSKKIKVAPFSDETLVSDESGSPPRKSRRSPDKVGQIKRFSQSNVDLSDSSDEENEEKNENKRSFDDLFDISPVAPKKDISNNIKIVFNTDSDDESDKEKSHANVDDLMGGTDDEVKSRDDDWDLENV